MESKPNSVHHLAQDAAWSISADTRQGAQEADACMAADEWRYAAPHPPAAGRPLAGQLQPPKPDSAY